MRLDTTLLPKPFQLSALTSRELTLESAVETVQPCACARPAPAEAATEGGDAMKLLLLIGGALAAVRLFLLATASGDTTLFARHYPLLLGLNAALAALLAALVA